MKSTVCAPIYFAAFLTCTVFSNAAISAVELSFSQRCAVAFEGGDPQLGKKVEAIFTEIAPDFVTGDSIRAEVGMLSEVQELLVLSGASPSTAQIAKDLIRTVIERKDTRNTVLGNLSSRLAGFRTDEKSLLVCVLNGGCRLTYGSAIHVVASYPVFSIVSFRSSDRSYEKAGWARSSREKYEIHEKLPRTIVMNGGSKVEAIHWASNFLHEATHFADFELVSDWVVTNVNILKSRGLPDALFAEYARMAPDGRIEVDEGFMRVFLESRAYSTELASVAELIGALNYRKMQIHSRQMAMKDIRSFNQVTSSVVNRLGLSESNVFEVGERLGRTMHATINKFQSRQ